MRIFFSVGEPSGDLHGANLISRLREKSPEIECVGYGGPKMAAAGCDLHTDLTRLAVMGIIPALLVLREAIYLAWKADRFFRHNQVDAVVLIDFPGFNWWIARRAKARGIPVYYYGTPQVWAWARWRVHKLRRLTDHVLCKLPFETPWFISHGCNATYVGHPYFDQLHEQQLDESFLQEHQSRDGPLVTILPGSRTQEVTANLASFLQAAEKIAADVPQVRFVVAPFRESHAELAKELVAQTDMQIDVVVGKTQELIHAASCAMACSGSVSLELLHHTKPTVVQYRISKFGQWAQKHILKVPYITLVNLLSVKDPLDDTPQTSEESPRFAPPEEALFPEYLTSEDKSTQMARHITQWLTDSDEYTKRVDHLTQLKARYGAPGASRRAADYITAQLTGASHGPPKPHFLSEAASPLERAVSNSNGTNKTQA